MKRKGILIIIITIIFFSLSMAHASDKTDIILTSENNENNQDYLEISNNESTLQENIMDNDINTNEEYEYPQSITIKIDENIENLTKYNNITIKVNLTTAWVSSEDDYYNTLNNNNFKIYENDVCIYEIPINQCTIPTYQHNIPITINTTFNFYLHDYSKLNVRFYMMDSNTLIFEKLNEKTFINLTNSSIIITDKNQNKKNSNNTWKNSFRYLNKSIELCENQGTININNLTIFADKILSNYSITPPIEINKSLKIIGNNLTINSLENPILFNITKGNVTFININFKNTTSYAILNNGNLTLINCTFSDMNRAINNTGILTIINSTISNITPFYSNGKIIYLNHYYSNVGVIYNTGDLVITNTEFINIDSAKKIEIINNTNTNYLLEEGIIYNLNNTNILNSNFTNINGRAINNTGKLNIENSIFENIIANSLHIKINLSEFKNLNEDIIYQNYTGMREKIDETYGMEGYDYYSLHGAGIYNTNKTTIKNTTFNRITGLYGGVIYNLGNITLYDSNLTNTQCTGYGGSICNNGEMIINNTKIDSSEAILLKILLPYIPGADVQMDCKNGGGGIYNNGTMVFTNSAIENSKSKDGHAITNNGILSIKNSTFKGNIPSTKIYIQHIFSTIHNTEAGYCSIYNSIFKNNEYDSYHGYPNLLLGIIFNEGKMQIDKCIFDNHTFPDTSMTTFLSGTLHIFNTGTLNVTHNIFLNTRHVNTRHPTNVTPFTFLFSQGNNEYIDYNYYCFNTDPYPIDSSVKVNNYFLFKLDEYHGYNINEIGNINATLRLANDEEFYNYNLLPDVNVTFTTLDENGDYINATKTMVNGKISIPYNFTKLKGSYHIFANLGGCVQECIVDVGKVPVIMDLKYENITYENNLTFEIKLSGNYSHPPTGNVSLYINNKKINSTALNNTFCNITLNKPNVGTYNYKIVYEGDEDYFRSYNYGTFNVDKCPTTLNITIPEIEYGETGIIYVTLNPTTTSGKAILYINGEEKSTSIRNGTKIKLNNYDIGEYNITLVFTEKDKYKSSNATAIFKVKKYETNLTINASDINAGESETITVTLTPEGEVAGEATFKINNHTEIIFLNNGETNITVENVTGGTYYIEVYFPGDKKYASSNATAKFTAKKLQSNITAKIENDILYINTTPNSTGKVQIFINDDVYEVNLKNSQIMFQVNFTKAENYIFIYYQGDGYYNYSEASLTYEYEGLLNLTGYDETFYNTENQTYYLTLTDEEGYGITNRTIAITLNNETSNLITGYDGSITYKLNLDAGNYTITAKYKSKTTTNTITILEDAFLTTINTNAYETIDFTYAAELKNHKGNPIKDAEVTFKIGNQTYKNKTNNQGLATIKLNLNEGNYQIKTTYKSITNTNNIIVQGLILKGNNLRIYNTESGTYTVSLTKENGEGIANKKITITLNNNTYKKTTDKNGNATLKISLDTGIYIIKATYNNKTITNTITVMEDAFLNTNDVKTFENTDFTFTAQLKDHKDNPIKNAKITFKIENKTYTKTTNNKGEATINLKLKRGNYIITTTYKSIINENNITIQEFNLTGEDITFYNTENATYHITLKDKKGNGIANEKIIITLNNETYTVTTDNNGSASKEISLDTGKYIIQAQYKNDIIKNTITVLEDAFLNTNDIKAYDDVDFTFAVELKDHKNNPIKNAKITFKIENKKYTRTTNNKGEAKLNLNLKKGNYIITTTYKSIINENYITVVNLKLKAENITFYNTQNGTYYATLINDEGHGIKGKTITITFNNTIYTKTTDENGNAILKIIDLDTGNYTIEAQYKNQIITNKITVLQDRFLSVNNTKAYENVDFTHIALLTDHTGKGVENEIITFKINGETYTNKTDKNGIAILNLNLKEGNYTITTIFKKITKRAKIIIVDDSHLVGNDVKAYSGMNFTYQTRLTDHNNDPITDALITFKIGNETFTNKTDTNGRSTLTFNLETGNYTITANYKNLTIENNFEIIEDYIIRGNDIKAYSETNFVYKVNLTDHNGKAIRNVEMTFIVDGITYTNKTDINGQAIITLSLKTGNYTIIAKYRNTTADNTLIIIEDYILSGNDVKALAYDDFPYNVNLTDHNGKAIGNAEIIFEVDGKTYTSITDEKGSAAITLNLPEGNYTITTKYKNTTATNELELVENYMLTGQNIKAYEYSDFTYTITLTRTDGTPISGKTITLVMNNKKYTNTTDSNGKASKTLNLPEGNYTITAIYKDTKITNNLSIIKDYNLIGNNIKAYSEKDFQYKVNLTDHNGNPIKNTEITFKMNEKTFKNKTDANGQAAIILNLKKGNYTIIATYNNIKTTNKLEIVETYLITGTNIKSYENFNFEYIVTLKNHSNKTIQNQKITFKVDGKTYTNTTNQNGQTKITLNLKKGNYTITATYQNITTTNKLEIIAYDLEQIESQDLEMYYKDGSRFTIRLTENNKPLTNKTVTFKINGASYTRTTNNDGYAGIAINLNSGKHNITTQYNNLTKQNTITIKTTITGNNITKIFRNDTQYYATFYNQKGEPLKNTPIYFNINGVFYTRTTNNNGTAKLNINLNPGKYIITATNPETTEQHSNTITVLSKIQENNDLTKYYKNESQYIVKIIKSNGQTAGAGEKVTFNINGVFYTRTTNETGHVKMNINLQPGTYIITAEYEGCQASNNIKVLPTIQAQDLTKKYRTTNPFEAKLLDKQGKPQANEKVTFNINGVFYTRTTNNNGTAKLNINLQPGTYIITSQYNDAITSNTIKITP